MKMLSLAYTQPYGLDITSDRTNNAVDVFSFTTFDEGTTWYGDIDGKDIK